MRHTCEGLPRLWLVSENVGKDSLNHVNQCEKTHINCGRDNSLGGASWTVKNGEGKNALIHCSVLLTEFNVTSSLKLLPL